MFHARGFYRTILSNTRSDSPASGFWWWIEELRTHIFFPNPKKGSFRDRNFEESLREKAETKSVLDNRHKCRVQVCLRESWRSYRFCQIQRSVLEHVVWLQRRHWGVRVLSNVLSNRTTANWPVKHSTPGWNLLMMANVGLPRPPAWLDLSRHL